MAFWVDPGHINWEIWVVLEQDGMVDSSIVTINGPIISFGKAIIDNEYGSPEIWTTESRNIYLSIRIKQLDLGGLTITIACIITASKWVSQINWELHGGTLIYVMFDIFSSRKENRPQGNPRNE